MKKLTAGIFTVIIVFSVISAVDAIPIASKGYVDAGLVGKVDAIDLANKADKAETLAGYGITDTMTTTQVNAALTDKVNTTDLGVLAKAAPGACSNPTNKCVLTFDGTDFAWEVIER